MLHGANTNANTTEIQRAASRLLYYVIGDRKSTVSRRWTKAWLIHNQDFIKIIKQRPLSTKRIQTHIIEDVQLYFDKFKKCKRYWKVHNDNVSNFNKTGFQIRVMLNRDLVTVPKDYEAVYYTDPLNRELVTSMETINYSGTKVPSIIIFKGVYYLQKHFYNDINKDIFWARSETGFITDKLGVKYLKHFHKFTKDIYKGYHLLVFNGHSSHLTQKFLDFY
jgi:hypothetical protein